MKRGALEVEEDLEGQSKQRTKGKSSKWSQFSPVLVLFVLGLLAGNLWNRSSSGLSSFEENQEEVALVEGEEKNFESAAPLREDRAYEIVDVSEHLSDRWKSNSQFDLPQEDYSSDDVLVEEGGAEPGVFTSPGAGESVHGTGNEQDVNLVADRREEEDVRDSLFKKEPCKNMEVFAFAASRSVTARSVQDFQTMYKYLINSLRCGRLVVHVSYDHEALLLTGHVYSIAHHTGQYFGKPLAPHEQAYQILRNDLISSLQLSEALKMPNYFFGVPLPPCKEGLQGDSGSQGQHENLGGDMSQLLILMSQLRGIKPQKLSYSSLLTGLSFERSELFFQDLLRECEHAYFVGFLSSINMGSNNQDFSERVVKIPGDAVQKWDLKREEILDRLLTFVEGLGKSSEDKPIILVSAGALTGVLISQMFSTNSGASYIDVDGLFDGGHAAYARKPKDQLSFPLHVAGDGEDAAASDPAVSRKEDNSIDGCTFSTYEREGDCVKASGDKALSPLCYPKGSRGKPEAGRIGGFFPHDVERQQEERKKKIAERRKKEAEAKRKKKELKLAKRASMAETLKNAEMLRNASAETGDEEMQESSSPNRFNISSPTAFIEGSET